jgi:hypothetical protein
MQKSGKKKQRVKYFAQPENSFKVPHTNKTS